jgi:hypothetical protein
VAEIRSFRAPCPVRNIPGRSPAVVNLRPGDDWPGTANVAAVLDRIASDVEELARARRAGELTIAAGLPGRSAERRRRLAEPDLDFRTFCRAKRDARLHAGADGTSLGCVAGRAVPPRGDRAAARLHRQPIPRALTTPTATLKRSIVVQETGRRSGATALAPARPPAGSMLTEAGCNRTKNRAKQRSPWSDGPPALSSGSASTPRGEHRP